jgi:HPt (histidine-containing phosphotransfer) domain-containing protein
MADDPLDAVHSYVERAYIRLQAGDVLIRCLDEATAEPIQQMVEALILAGPSSISVLQEILSEAEQRKGQVLDDLHQLKARAASLELDSDGSEMINNLEARIRLLEEIETYLQDWVWALAYQSTRQILNDIKPSGENPAL